MNALHEQFVAEARELIHQATDDLIAAEREGFSPEQVDRVFRAFHTLKGSAGVVDLPAMGLALHAAEDVLAAISAGRVASSPGLIDDALACLDQVLGWVDAFESHQALPPRAGEDARTMAERLRKRLSAPAGALPARSAPIAAEPALPDWATRLVASWRERVRPAASVPSQLFALTYEPLAGCFFNGDDPLELMRRVPNLLAFHIEAREAWPPLGDFDPFACNLRLQGLTSATREELAALFRLVPDQVRIFRFPACVLRPDRGSAALGDARDLVRAVLEEQMHVLRAAAPDEDHDRPLRRCVRGPRPTLFAMPSAMAMGATDRERRCRGTLRSRIAVTAFCSPIDEALSALAEEFPKRRLPARERRTQPRAASRLLRVDESKIDALLDLAGELLVVRTASRISPIAWKASSADTISREQ